MILKIKVQPNSGRQEITKLSEDEYKIFLKKPSEDGKANAELIKLLTKHLGKKVKIVSGKTSKKKLVEVL